MKNNNKFRGSGIKNCLMKKPHNSHFQFKPNKDIKKANGIVNK